jgi:hypothetical protein
MKFYHRLHYLIIHFFNQQQMLRLTPFETVTVSNMKRMGVIYEEDSPTPTVDVL